MVWNGPLSEWRLSVECQGRSEWNNAAAAVRLRWQSPRPSLEIKALIARMGYPPGSNGAWDPAQEILQTWRPETHPAAGRQPEGAAG